MQSQFYIRFLKNLRVKFAIRVTNIWFPKRRRDYSSKYRLFPKKNSVFHAKGFAIEFTYAEPRTVVAKTSRSRIAIFHSSCSIGGKTESLRRVTIWLSVRIYQKIDQFENLCLHVYFTCRYI